MTKLPQVPGKQVVKALKRAGFYLNRWHGSHAIMVRWGEIIYMRCTLSGLTCVGPCLSY